MAKEQKIQDIQALITRDAAASDKIHEELREDILEKERLEKYIAVTRKALAQRGILLGVQSSGNHGYTPADTDFVNNVVLQANRLTPDPVIKISATKRRGLPAARFEGSEPGSSRQELITPKSQMPSSREEHSNQQQEDATAHQIESEKVELPTTQEAAENADQGVSGSVSEASSDGKSRSNSAGSE